MFLRVKLDRTSTTKKFVPTNGEETEDWVRNPYHSSLAKECITFTSANVVTLFFFISPRKVVQVGNVEVLEEDPYSRNNRDGTAVKLDVSTEVFTLVMWYVSMRIWLLECQKQNW